MQQFLPVIFSIGTNLGDKLRNIEACIAEINKKIGVVYKVSKLYESASWGFKSDNFYNCAVLVYTQLSAQATLIKIHEIETNLGRAEKSTNEYEARIIDIDIVDFNHEIIDLTNLQIPHKHLVNRKFVLLPLADIMTDYFHPIEKKTVFDLIKECKDTSHCEPILKLKTPLEVAFQRLKYSVIEGNIGSGKTSLAKKIAHDFNGKTILERFENNPFLSPFYEDPSKHAFQVEMVFLEDRHQQLKFDLQETAADSNFFIGDYHLYKSVVFARTNLQKDDFETFKINFDTIYKDVQQPNFVIYLHQNTPTLLKNIKRRNRRFEENLNAHYLEKINESYRELIQKQLNNNLLVVDISNKNFVENRDDYFWILEEVTNKINSFFY